MFYDEYRWFRQNVRSLFNDSCFVEKNNILVRTSYESTDCVPVWYLLEAVEFKRSSVEFKNTTEVRIEKEEIYDSNACVLLLYYNSEP